jgi:hypothetical protein
MVSVGGGDLMGKKWRFALVFFFLLTLSCFGVTYTINTVTATISTYSGTSANVSVNLTVTRSDTTGGATPIYLLVSGATLDGNYLVGTRRVYQGGSLTGNSMQVFLQNSSSQEIGTTNTGGTYVASATFVSTSTTRTVSVKLVTGTGKLPKGSPTTYTNTFQFQLYTGSLLAGSGTIQSGVVGTINASVTSTTTSTFSMSLGASSVSFGTNLAVDNSYTASTTLTVTAPATFSISAKSGNLGYLVCSGGESFPYHLYFNGSATESSLTGGLVKLITSATAVSGKSYALSFKTDTLGFLVAGDYSDTLTLMFTTQ